MLAVPYLGFTTRATFLAMLIVVISMAGALWREARRDRRRRRLVRNVESILRDEGFDLSEENHLKRVA
jgi:hypothetical protein